MQWENKLLQRALKREILNLCGTPQRGHRVVTRARSHVVIHWDFFKWYFYDSFNSYGFYLSEIFFFLRLILFNSETSKLKVFIPNKGSDALIFSKTKTFFFLKVIHMPHTCTLLHIWFKYLISFMCNFLKKLGEFEMYFGYDTLAFLFFDLLTCCHLQLKTPWFLLSINTT